MELELPWAAEKVGCSRTGHVDAQPAPQSSLGVGGGGDEVEPSQGTQLTELDRSGGAGQGEEQGTVPCSVQPVS